MESCEKPASAGPSRGTARGAGRKATSPGGSGLLHLLSQRCQGKASHAHRQRLTAGLPPRNKAQSNSLARPHEQEELLGRGGTALLGEMTHISITPRRGASAAACSVCAQPSPVLQQVHTQTACKWS